MIDLDKCFNSFKSILCLNGEIPAAELFLRTPGLPIIAADGAGHALIRMGIIPNIIVGDLDSLNKSELSLNTEVIHIADQNSTDFEKCLAIIEARQLFPCLIYGATGKETDHTVYNLNVMAEYATRHLLVFHDSAYTAGEKYGVFVTEKLIGNLQLNAKISVFTLSNAVVSSKGLNWELDKMILTSRISSSRNFLKTNPLDLIVHKGIALVMFDQYL